MLMTAYIGANNTAHRVKKMYVGDSNGIARCMYDPKPLAKINDSYTSISDSSNTLQYLPCRVNNYALFGPSVDSERNTSLNNRVFIINTNNNTSSTSTSNYYGGDGGGSGSVGNYALMGLGRYFYNSNWTYYNIMTVFNSSLTKSNLSLIINSINNKGGGMYSNRPIDVYGVGETKDYLILSGICYTYHTESYIYTSTYHTLYLDSSLVVSTLDNDHTHRYSKTEFLDGNIVCAYESSSAKIYKINNSLVKSTYSISAPAIDGNHVCGSLGDEIIIYGRSNTGVIDKNLVYTSIGSVGHKVAYDSSGISCNDKSFYGSAMFLSLFYNSTPSRSVEEAATFSKDYIKTQLSHPSGISQSSSIARSYQVVNGKFIHVAANYTWIYDGTYRNWYR